jgi:hypothetical protein
MSKAKLKTFLSLSASAYRLFKFSRGVASDVTTPFKYRRPSTALARGLGVATKIFDFRPFCLHLC